MVNKTFNEVATEWKKMIKPYVKKSTYSAYSLIIENHLVPFFGNKTSISEQMVQNYAFEKFNSGLSTKSIKDTIVVLKMIAKYGDKIGFHGTTNWDIIFPTELRKDSIEVLDLNTQRKIMSYVKRNISFRNLGIYLCLSTGVRIGELCALQWKDIDTDTGYVSVNKTIARIYLMDENGKNRTEVVIDTPKTQNSLREIPIYNELLKLLKPLKRIVNPEYYVLTNSPTPLEPRTYRNYYKKLMKTLNVPNIKFHGLRHSFATRCIESNCDYKTVSVLLGHSNINTTLNLYVHPNLNQKKKCINKMFKMLE